MVIVRRSARRILSVGAILGFATLGGCAETDLTSPTPHRPPAAATVSHDDAPCPPGWVISNGVLVCQGI
ncbi:MAG TPA: hypothetical protein VJO33_05960 [Gemmatimonadaceae bacterium]|nr:hypothetical protein [Gemmatimonadaceae bacterium]